ncbi:MULTISPECIES: hypothetical protein [Streptomyces]|uniref:TIGR04222 domain-containing membrane protein n=1 Tax=Streptomyces heilongjiangensis TaxID=945052 RepID=A0ABW1BC52_9ACTN|nr:MULTISPECIES: hypothetical protein [Streptomyces]MDC2946289.1 hypothetical protein [Streptomyces heilongjiangensis]
MIVWLAWAGSAVGYAVLVLGALSLDQRIHTRAVAQALARHRATQPEPADAVPDEDLRLGVAAVAVLAQGDGSVHRAFFTVITDMVARGVLKPATEDDGTPTLRIANRRRACPPDASEAEAELRSHAAHQNPAAADPHSVMHPTADRLMTEGYLRGRGVYIDFERPCLFWSRTVAALTLPLAALETYAFLDWRYALVAGWTSIAMIVVAWGLALPDGDSPRELRLPVLTERGEQVVRQARARHAHLDPAKRPAARPYAPDEAAAAYAVFGEAAYAHFAAHTPGFAAAVTGGVELRLASRAAEHHRRHRTDFLG